MSKKIFCIIVILLMIVTGCSNVKFLGKKLNKEETIINDKKINYLEELYKNVNVIFVGRTEGYSSCKCKKGGLDGACLIEECQIIPDKYIWKYDICSKKITNFCTSASYNDVEEKWNINLEEDFKYINIVLDILDKHNIVYNTFTSSGNIQYFIMIKKGEYIDNLIRAIEDIYKYDLTTNNSSLTHNSSIEIVIFNENDYNFILKHTDKDTKVYGSYTLYELLTGNQNFGTLIEKKDFSKDMFNCYSSKFTHISYELFSNDGKIQIWCTGIK